jgi:vancomycin permeability regulator SanA
MIDTSFLPRAFGVVLMLASGALLVAYAAAPQLSQWRGLLTLVACALLTAVALINCISFYGVWAAGSFSPHVPIPLSLVIAAAMGFVGWSVWSLAAPEAASPHHAAAVIAFVIAALLFPLAQIGFFGTSDYRTTADAAVVFGATVLPHDVLSTSLADRVNTAVDLYREGLVSKLVMSGAEEVTHRDEPEAMREAAIREGVPADAILVDDHGVDTNATVADTVPMFRRDGIRSVLAVSQGYHLPRVKLAYLAAGVDVRTVPAGTSTPIPQTPLYMVREIPGFWVYWAGSLLRG